MLRGGSKAKQTDKVPASALVGIGLFQGVPKKEMGHIAAQFRPEFFGRGEAIVKAGDEGARLIVITEGEAKLLSPEGRTRKRLGKGAIIGELSILDPAPRTATIEASSDVDAVSISSTGFLALLEEQPAMARAVMRTLVRRLRASEKESAHH